MNQTISTGNVPAVRASRDLRMIDVRKKCTSALALRKYLNPTACLTVGVIATVVLFFSLGAQCVPAIFASGLVALLAVAVAPVKNLDQEGGAL